MLFLQRGIRERTQGNKVDGSLSSFIQVSELRMRKTTAMTVKRDQCSDGGSWVRGHLGASNEFKSLSSDHVTCTGWEKLLYCEEPPRMVDLGNGDKSEYTQGRQQLETVYYTNTLEDMCKCQTGL